MAKYRKKPVVIEAFQMSVEHRRDNSEWPDWLTRAWNKEPGIGALFIDDLDSQHHLIIGTLEGLLRVEWDDWIIQGVKGELYAVKDEIFRLTYDEVPNATS